MRLDDGTKIFFFFLIMCSNSIFFIYWFYKMGQELLNKFRQNFQRAYLYICLCGDEAKLEEELKKRKIQDENDILREEYIRCKIVIYFNLM